MISVQSLKESFLNKIMKTEKMKEKYEKKRKSQVTVLYLKKKQKSGDIFIFKKGHETFLV